MLRSEKEEMDIILSRAGYVLTCCAVIALFIVMVLIYNSK
jgi:hypothetical protein